MRHYCTYFDIKYVPMGLALHESLEAHCQPYHLHVLALCGEAERVLRRLALPNVTATGMSEFLTPALEATRADRTWQEFIWTMTGSWMLHVADTNGLDQVSYIDSDCYFFGEPSTVWAEIGDAPVAITPHRSSRTYQGMASTNGLYNVGLVYARWPEGRPCIAHWADQCIEWCYYRYEPPNRFCDQKYLDDWPGRWGAHPIAHKGANLAPWNQGEGQYVYSMRGGRLHIDDDPLVWYHFHAGLDSGHPIDSAVQKHIYWPYAKALDRAKERIC